MRHLQEIPITQLTVPKQNVRAHNIGKGLEELKVNIKAIGLIEPISVYKDQSGQYVVLAGQRRLNAYHGLNEEFPSGGFDKIECLVTDPPKDDDMKRAISLGENITHLPMSKEDLQNAVTELYNKEGNYKKIEEKFGLKKGIVDKYVNLARLPQTIKESIKSGGIHTKQKVAEKTALQAVDALEWTDNGNVSEGKVLELANIMADKENIGIKKEIVKEIKKNPEGDIHESIKRAQNRTYETIKLHLEPELDSKLSRYSEKEGDVNKEDTIVNIISEKLNSEFD